MRRHLLALGCVLLITPLAATQEKQKLPEGAALRIGVHRLRVAGPITDYTFTPDQRTLIVVYDEKDSQKPNVVLFDVATGLERKRLPIRGAQHLAMAKHKPLMAVDTFNGIEVWDVVAFKRLRQWDYPECVDEASALTISPDGGQVVVAAPTLLRWNVETGAALPTFRPRPSMYRIGTLQFSADGSKLITAETYTSEYRQRRDYFGDVYPGSPFFESLNYNLYFATGLFGPRTRLLHHTLWAVGSKLGQPALPLAAVLDAKSGARLLEFGSENGDYAFSPDGTMVALRATNTLNYQTRIDIFRLERGWPLVGTVHRPGPVVFSPDSKRLLVNGSLWDIAARKLTPETGMDYSSMVRFSQDGKLLAVARGDEAPSMGYGKYYTYASPYPSTFGETQSNFLQLVDVATGLPRSYPDGYAEAVGGLAYSPDGKWLASFSGPTIFIHDARTGAELRRWIGHKLPIEHLAFSPDGTTLASACRDTRIALWDPTTGKERQSIVAIANQVPTQLAFTADAKVLVSLTDAGSVWRVDVATGKRIDPTPSATTMMAPRLSPTGEHVAYLEQNKDTGVIRLQWMRTRTGKTLATGETHLSFAQPSGTDSLAFSADGKLLAASGYPPMTGVKLEHAVRVWECVTQREIARFESNQQPTRLLALSPDGRILAHGSGPPLDEPVGVDGLFAQKFEFPIQVPASMPAIVLRDLASTQGSKKDDDRALPPITGHLGPITCLTFSPDGKFLATGGADQVVYIWRVEHFFKPAAVTLFKGEVVELWPHLADADAGKAFRAMALLERRPIATIALLRKHLQPAAVTEPKIIDKHVRDLSVGSFAVRAQAYAALEKLGAEALPQLKTAVQKPADLEVKRRLEALVDKVDRPFEVTDNIRIYRALTLLERLGTPDARQLLEELARGAPSAWLTTEARQSLQRAAKKIVQ